MTFQSTELPGRPVRVWAIRTSRENSQHRDFLRSELQKGLLRQGWGWLPQQDLRALAAAVQTGSFVPAALDAWPHWRMLGARAPSPADAILPRDLIVLPNFPIDGVLQVVRVIGDYDYAPDPEIGDLGHILPVSPVIATVRYDWPQLDQGLRDVLNHCQRRLWSLDAYRAAVGEILIAALDDDPLAAALAA